MCVYLAIYILESRAYSGIPSIPFIPVYRSYRSFRYTVHTCIPFIPVYRSDTLNFCLYNGILCWVPRSIMKVKTMLFKDKSHLFWTLFWWKLQNRRSEFVLNFIAKTFCFCLLCVQFLVNILFLYITVKLDFDIDRKSANFDFKILQNISLRFHLIMNLLWTFHGTITFS